jgi:hypothetical protein
MDHIENQFLYYYKKWQDCYIREDIHWLAAWEFLEKKSMVGWLVGLHNKGHKQLWNQRRWKKNELVPPARCPTMQFGVPL